MSVRALILACCLSFSGLVQAGTADAALAQQVDAFVDGWHDDAAHARMAFFDKMAPDGVYIGTDRGEHWDRAAFRAWARKSFEEQHRGWTFHATRRNVYAAADGKFIWFDELIDAASGKAQPIHYMASGVIRKTAGGFEIVHYQLSFAVPNEVAHRVLDDVIWPAEANAGAQ